MQSQNCRKKSNTLQCISVTDKYRHFHCKWFDGCAAVKLAVQNFAPRNSGECERLQLGGPRLGDAWQPFLFGSADAGRALFLGEGDPLALEV